MGITFHTHCFDPYLRILCKEVQENGQSVQCPSASIVVLRLSTSKFFLEMFWKSFLVAEVGFNNFSLGACEQG